MNKKQIMVCLQSLLCLGLFSPAFSTPVSSVEKEESFFSSNLGLTSQSFQENSHMDMFWKAAFNPQTFYDRSSTNTIIKTEIYGKLKWILLDAVSFQTQILILGRNGFTQSIYDREDRSSGLNLLEGFFEWNPASSFSLQVGNIQQNFLESPLLVTDKTFPSFVGKVSFDDLKDWSFLFRTSIPDNASESIRREAQIIRGVPLFVTASALFSRPTFLWNNDVRETLTLFYYYNLSPAVADRSRLLGNSIERTASDSTFAYDFLGIHNNLAVKRSLSANWIMEMGVEFLYNFLAPDTRNEGLRVYSAFYNNYENLIEFKWMGEIFANQSDASVAYYNSEIYGHNDRRGVLLRLQSHFYNSGLTLGASFVYTQPINDPHKSPVGDSFSFALSLITNYIAI